MFDNLVVDVDRRVGGQGKADAFIAAAARDDRRIDPDDFAGQVHQRPPGVSRVNGRIRLQEPLELMRRPADPGAILGADDSRGHRGLQPKRAADRQHPVTDPHAVRVSKLRDGQVFPGINLYYCQVGILIDAHYLRRISC